MLLGVFRKDWLRSAPNIAIRHFAKHSAWAVHVREVRNNASVVELAHVKVLWKRLAHGQMLPHYRELTRKSGLRSGPLRDNDIRIPQGHITRIADVMVRANVLCEVVCTGCLQCFFASSSRTMRQVFVLRGLRREIAVGILVIGDVFGHESCVRTSKVPVPAVEILLHMNFSDMLVQAHLNAQGSPAAIVRAGVLQELQMRELNMLNKLIGELKSAAFVKAFGIVA